MIKFINATTGTSMWVADGRKEEYMRAGHKLAPIECEEPKKTVEMAEEPKEEPKEEPTEKPKKGTRGRKKK